MKKTILLFFLFFSSFPIHTVHAASTNKRIFPFDITSVNMNEKEIIIQGWGMAVEKHHYDSTNSHYYSLVLKSNKKQIIYKSKPKYNSQTKTMQVLNTRKCGTKEYGKSGSVCYYNYDYVGFEFRIPLSDLNVDETYETKLFVHSNILNFQLGTDLFYPILTPLRVLNENIEYKVTSNLYDTKINIADSEIFDRISPYKNSKIRKSNSLCSAKYGYNRYFEKGSKYTHVYDRYKNESTVFYKVKTNKSSICKADHNMIYEGKDYDSWIASNWVDYSGEQLKIQVKDINEAPIIRILNNPTISLDDINGFNFKKYVEAVDKEDGIITNKIIITNKVDLKRVGIHFLELEVQDKYGKKAKETLIVNVIEGNTPPTIYANDVTIYQYSSFDYLKNIQAIDKEDGDVSNTITYTGNVNTKKIGTYTITYYAYDSKNKISSKTIQVQVIKNPKEKIRYISNQINRIFYKVSIPINWRDDIEYLKDQIQNPKIFIKRKIELR